MIVLVKLWYLAYLISFVFIHVCTVLVNCVNFSDVYFRFDNNL